MKIVIDTEKNSITKESGNDDSTFELYSKDSFKLLSYIWLKVAWDLKYVYSFSWMGRPIIQLPEDMIRVQEVIYRVKPDVIIETGIAHGGSLIYYASLCKAMGKGRVIGVDIEVRPHNLKAIKDHELSPNISLIEGSSIDSAVVKAVKAKVKPGETAIVILDSCHSKQHVLNELESYYDLITPGSYIVVTDGFMKDLNDVPRGMSEWIWNNPQEAAKEFVKTHENFVIEEPPFPFNEGGTTERITYWPNAFLKRLR